MRRFAGRAVLVLVAAAATAAGVLLIGGDDDGGEGRPAGGNTPAASGSPDHPAKPGPGHAEAGSHESTRQQVREAVHQSGSPRLDPDQRDVAAAVRGFVAALNARDGSRACALFVPGALAAVDFPGDRGGCAASLSASVGYRDPRGFPVYESARVPRIPRVVIEGSTARVTATTVTRFADRREPSVEDDVIYLRSADGRWLIAKPSATLYRAIGVGNIPPQVLTPP